MVICNPLDKSVELFGDLGFPNFYKSEIDAIDDDLSALILNTYTKAEVYNSITNIDLFGSENINVTNSQTSLTCTLKLNNEAFLTPRLNV